MGAAWHISFAARRQEYYSSKDHGGYYYQSNPTGDLVFRAIIASSRSPKNRCGRIHELRENLLKEVMEGWQCP
jgi:hypothetical protein